MSWTGLFAEVETAYRREGLPSPAQRALARQRKGLVRRRWTFRRTGWWRQRQVAPAG